MRRAPGSLVVRYRPIGNDGEALILIPVRPHNWNVVKATANTISARRRTAAGRVLLILPNRPVIVMVCGSLGQLRYWFRGSCRASRAGIRARLCEYVCEIGQR